MTRFENIVCTFLPTSLQFDSRELFSCCSAQKPMSVILQLLQRQNVSKQKKSIYAQTRFLTSLCDRRGFLVPTLSSDLPKSSTCLVNHLLPIHWSTRRAAKLLIIRQGLQNHRTFAFPLRFCPIDANPPVWNSTFLRGVALLHVRGAVLSDGSPLTEWNTISQASPLDVHPRNRL